MSICDISLVFLNYSLGIELHTCLFKFDERAVSKQSAQKDARTSLSILYVTCGYLYGISMDIMGRFV